METTRERLARFNGCRDVFAIRDLPFGSPGIALRWIVMHGDAEKGHGWNDTENGFRTLRDAQAYMEREYPSFPHWRVFLRRIDGRTGRRPLNTIAKEI